jgi:hypothetical protein
VLGVATALVLLPARAASGDILDLSAGVFPDDQLTALSSSGDPFAVGGGTTAGFVGGPGTKFAFSAHLGPNGPSGYAVFSIPSGAIQGHVICYEPLSTNQGTFAFRVEKATGVFASFVGETAEYIVRDSGQPSSAASGDDIVPFHRCSFRSSFEPSGGLVLQGNIVVKN